VNLASRLESACKQYGAHILASEFTFKRLRGTYRAREIDLLLVKGKTKPIAVYEILDYHTEDTYPRASDALGRFRDGLAKYRRRDFAAAKRLFLEVLEINSEGQGRANVRHALRPADRNPAALRLGGGLGHGVEVTTLWPALPLDDWRDTRDTLQLWTQIAGKICLALTPRVNHFWNIALQITSRGLTTLPMPAGERTFTLMFDFVSHEMVLSLSDGTRDAIPLRPQTVAEFHRAVMEMLKRQAIAVRDLADARGTCPSPSASTRTRRTGPTTPDAARRCFDILLAAKPVFDDFRAQFIGKCSPLHFFWGGFDLAVTRFSGRTAPERPGADAVTRESYSHEVISHGWWPGSGAVNEPAFYAYAAPEPDGLKTAPVAPAAAYYSTEMSLLVLPYEAVRTSATPEADLRAFLDSTYEAAARLAKWDRKALERG
jgi:hypothetical protein